MATPPVPPFANIDPSFVLHADGTFSAAGGGSGTVTSVATAAPVTGGPITTSGTIGVSDFDGTNAGVVPAGPNDATKYLDGTGNFTVPAGSSTGTVTSVATSAPITGGTITTTGTIGISDFVASGASHARGAVPDPGASSGTTKFLREDASWQVPSGTSGGSVNYDPNRAPSSPSASDDEFATGSLDGSWTQFGTPDTVSCSTYFGYVFIEDNDNTVCGIYKSYTPGAAALSIVSRIRWVLKNQFSTVAITLTDSSGTSLGTSSVQHGASSEVHWRSGATGGTNSTEGALKEEGTAYLMLTRDSSTNYKAWYSWDGFGWHNYNSWSQAGAIGRIQLDIFGATGGVGTGWYDFIRVFTSQLAEDAVIGSAP